MTTAGRSGEVNDSDDGEDEGDDGHDFEGARLLSRARPP